LYSAVGLISPLRSRAARIASSPDSDLKRKPLAFSPSNVVHVRRYCREANAQLSLVILSAKVECSPVQAATLASHCRYMRHAQH
jgi:hypothetical protein